MRVLMTCQPAFSHGTQLLPLHGELGRRGHQVIVATSATYARELAGYGVETRTFAPDWTMRPGDPVFDRTVGSHHFFGFPEVPDQTTVDELSDIAASFEPDLVIREYSEFTGWAVACRLGVPLMTQGIIHRLSPPAEDAVVGGVGRIAALADVDPPHNRDALLGAAYLDIVPPSFRCPWEHATSLAQPARPSSFDGHVGLAPAWLDRLGRERTAVYVTLGTIFADAPSAWQAVIAALAELDVDAVITTGGTRPDDMPAAPPNVRIEQYIPQSQVLPRCRAVVCHGGFSTMVGAFVHGLPVVCLPLDADQPVNARCCAAAGAGINAANGLAIDPRGPMVDPDTLDASHIAASISAVLDEPAFAAASGRLGDEIRSMPGPDAIADLIGHLVGLTT